MMPLSMWLLALWAPFGVLSTWNHNLNLGDQAKISWSVADQEVFFLVEVMFKSFQNLLISFFGLQFDANHQLTLQLKGDSENFLADVISVFINDAGQAQLKVNVYT